jgi:hypothetical protein
MKPMVEASLRFTPDMMLAPAMSQHEGAGITVEFSQQKVPPEVEHCDSFGVFPTLVIGRQNCGHDGDDPIRLRSIPWSIYYSISDFSSHDLYQCKIRSSTFPRIEIDISRWTCNYKTQHSRRYCCHWPGKACNQMLQIHRGSSMSCR